MLKPDRKSSRAVGVQTKVRTQDSLDPRHFGTSAGCCGDSAIKN